jgi:hypothetical protein
MRAYPTKAYLEERLSYNPGTGIFTWKPIPELSRHERRWNTVFAGTVAGYHQPNAKGKVVRVKIDVGPYKRMYGHRLAMIISGVEVPEGMDIDHENRDPTDNRLCNLRVASRSQNVANGGLKDKKPSGGYLGVYTRKGTSKYVAFIASRKTKKSHTGYFDDPKEAAMQRDVWAIKMHGEFATLNFPRSLYHLTA